MAWETFRPYMETHHHSHLPSAVDLLRSGYPHIQLDTALVVASKKPGSIATFSPDVTNVNAATAFGRREPRLSSVIFHISGKVVVADISNADPDTTCRPLACLAGSVVELQLERATTWLLPLKRPIPSIDAIMKAATPLERWHLFLVPTYT